MTATNTACEGQVSIELSAWATKISPKFLQKRVP